MIATKTTAKAATVSLQEYATASVAGRVDRERGIIRGVKIIGLKSANGRVYPLETLERAKSLYEGAKVNLNHPQRKPSDPRDYRDRFGKLRSIVVRPDGLYGDLHYNPKHPVAEQLIWDVEHAPQNVGLSHNIEARTRDGDGGRLIVTEISFVRSVDLVSDPATTKGLFESHAPGGNATKGASTMVKKSSAQTLREIRRLRNEIRKLRGERVGVVEDSRSVMANWLPSEKVGDGTKKAYRQFVIDAAIGADDPTEDDIGETLALMGKNVDDFRKDVQEVKLLFQKIGCMPSKDFESDMARESIGHSSGVLATVEALDGLFTDH